jgi:SAM-dependent methyltransferase
MDGMAQAEAFWEQADVVERFAARDPDHRLRALLEKRRVRPERALDVGCAGGRNTLFLAWHRVEVHAIDTSSAMLEETRTRLGRLIGEEIAQERVQYGGMDDLSRFTDTSFDLLISLGVLHNARSWPEWNRAVDEAARVLRPDGLLLLSEFGPGTDLTGEGMRPVNGEPHVFDGFQDGRGVLLDPDAIDAELARRGLMTEDPTEAVTVKMDAGQRVSVNGLYRRA